MPRIARAVAVGIPHHVTQRDNRRQPTFFCEEEYRWSGAAVHLAGRDDFFVSVAPLHRLVTNWESFLSEAPDEREVRLLRKQERTGKPLGNPSFGDRLKKSLGRTLRPQPPGPKKKK